MTTSILILTIVIGILIGCVIKNWSLIQDIRSRVGDEIVFCEDCGICLKKDKAQDVEVVNVEVVNYIFPDVERSHDYYCKNCHKSYDEIYIYSSSIYPEYFKIEQEKHTEVDIKGKPIKTKKSNK